MRSLTESSDEGADLQSVVGLPAEQAHEGLGSAFTRVSAFFSAVLAAMFVALAVCGTIRAWHPLPFWDMWDGYVGFWYRLRDGDLSAWWGQHNEHRIVLARAFFWFDLRLLRGSGWFLIVCNLLAVAGIATALLAALRMRLRSARDQVRSPAGTVLLASVLVSLASAWMQHENFAWGFQIQFLLASLLPLMTFLALGRAVDIAGASGSKVIRWHALGCVCAVLSVGTMASGLAVPFVAVAELAALRARRSAVVSCTAVALAMAGLYLFHYNAVSGNAGALTTVATRPRDAAFYFFRYLGGPAEHATGSSTLGLIAGLTFVGIFGVVLATSRTRAAGSAVKIAMLSFMTYVLLGGAMTTAGRLGFGIQQAISSRYQTPVLVAWACLLIIAAPRVQQGLRRRGLVVSTALLAIPVLLLPQQAAALADHADFLGAQDVATLAIALGVPDEQAVGSTYPSPSTPLRLGRRLEADGLTVLGREPYRGLLSRINKHLEADPTTACRATFRSAAKVDGSRYWRVSATLSPRPFGAESRAMPIIDGRGVLVGFAAANPSERGHGPFGEEPPAVQLVGYVHAPASLSELRVVDAGKACQRR